MAIKNIADFVKELQKIPRLRDSDLFFRGHSDIEYKLEPSIYRNRKFSTKIMKKWLGLNDKSSKGIEIPTSRSEIEWPKVHGSGEGQDFFEQMQIKESMNNLEISN